jgi:hypothetical protein
MIYKIAREFKIRGYETILITICQRDKFNNPKLYERAFDKIICSNFQIFKPTPKNAVNMIRRIPYLIKSICEIRKLKPYAIFDIARPNYIAAIFMKFFKKYPIIYFPVDITSQLHTDLKSALRTGKKNYEIKAERYCFENADGILHKGAPEELDYLHKENMLGKPLKMAKNIICFNPYCSDEFIVPLNKEKLSKKDGFFHLVYVGSFFNTKEDMNMYINFFKKLINQKIHIHLYTKTHHLSVEDDKKIIAPIIDALKNSKYLHLDFAFPPKELIYEISKYDFGIWMDILRDQTGEEHRYVIGNKFSTYLEAGIPFCYTSTFKFIDKLMKEYKLPLPIDTNKFEDLDDFAERLKKLDYKKLEQNIMKARNDFNIKNHFSRLEEFIKKIVGEKS